MLVANRGEIALRIVRACRESGLESVAVYSEVDRDLRGVREADASLCIGKPQAKLSYLNRALLIEAALATQCDALHPGYGFLSEDAAFATACAENGITFVGPPAGAIAQMGDKIAAKRVAASIGVPLVPGGTIADDADLGALAPQLPYPVLLKAAAGGGGRGMRIVERAFEFAPALTQARNEAREAFGDGTVYWESYVRNARHVEVQVLSDAHGNHRHLGERDCTLQRRHQKLLEESPSPVLTPATRRELCDSAAEIVRALDYRNAGTIEFLFDADRGSFHFIEMNTRVQVEHPVTEMVTGVDIVREQLRIAGGAPMDVARIDRPAAGHAIECRINAEDPSADFAPSPGRITRLVPPGGPGVRVDTHCETGTVVSPFYDSMIAKLIVWDVDRESARRRMLRALGEFVVEGISTTIDFHREIISTPEFAVSAYNTRWVGERHREAVAV
ncbi:MAG TPA: acetyl-CoA carboxylase biotin carboxylase subunit [Candidatus Elarobacter sp.]|nr:acetyl-CoA carboxylase biotin carboxylase subunit [Candidatus Elarobacter sp.]